MLHFRGQIIRYLAEVGHQLYILAPINIDNPQQAVSHNNITFIDVPLSRGIANIVGELKALYYYRQQLKAIKPDVIFSYVVKASFFTRLINWKIPHVNFITGLGSGLSAGKYQWGILKLLSLLRFFEKKFKKNQEIFVFLNNPDRNFFLQYDLCNAKDSVVFPGEGVDLSYYRYSPLVTHDKPVAFLFIGRLLKDKGVLELLAAAQQLKQKHIPFTCTAIAPVDRDNPTYLAHITARDFADSGIDYIASVDDVRPFLQACDIVVLPSYTEGLPRVLLEAMAVGRPIIASDISGCRELVNDSNGFLIPAKDSDALAAMMESVSKMDNRELTCLGNAGYERVKTQYSIESIIECYQQLLKRL